MDVMMLFGLGWIIAILLMLLQLFALVWIIYDVLTKQKRMPDSEKVLWIIIAFFTTILGALIYYLLVKREGKYEGEAEEPRSSDEPVVF